MPKTFSGETNMRKVRTRYDLANFMEIQRGEEDGGNAGCAACRVSSTASSASTRCTRGRLVSVVSGSRVTAAGAGGEFVELPEVPVAGCDVGGSAREACPVRTA